MAPNSNGNPSVDPVAAVSVCNERHAWECGGAQSAEALTAWVSARLAAHEAALAALLAIDVPRTAENTLRLYDAAIEHLSLAGAQAGILNSVAADKAVRDQAQHEAQRVAMAGSALSLNRGVYEALAAMRIDGCNAATAHYVERTLLGYRLAGVDKDEATRDAFADSSRKGHPSLASSSAATSRRAAKPSTPPPPSSKAFRPTTSPAIPPTRWAASPSPPIRLTCSRS